MRHPRGPFVVIGGSFHGEVLDVSLRGGAMPVVLQRPDPVAVFDPAAPTSPAVAMPRPELYDPRRFAMHDPYSDPRQWADVVALDEAEWRRRMGQRGTVHPERRDGWFLVSSSLDGETAMRHVLDLFGEVVSRRAYQRGTGVWEWLGAFGERHLWDDLEGRYVEAGRPAGTLLGIPASALAGGGPVGSAAQVAAALAGFRSVVAGEAATGRPWHATAEAREDVLAAVAFARRRLVAEALSERAEPEQEAAWRRRAADAQALAEPLLSPVVDPEADLAAADAAGEGWRERADAALAEIDRVLSDGTQWTTPARWTPDLEEHADA